MARASTSSPSAPASVDLEELEKRLKALSFSNRLELLELLRVPRTVDEIHLTPSAGVSADEEDRQRPLSREAVRHHLERLDDAGLVRSELSQDPDGRSRKRYVLDESRLYALSETLRRLCHRDGGDDGALRRTQDGPGEVSRPWPAAPRLVLVHGAPRQRAFALRNDALEPPRGWIVGRSPEAHVTLRYDPYVSAQNTEILPADDGFKIVNLRSARNGTGLNDRLLEPGEEHEVSHGDVVRVGSSVLVFHRR